MRLDGTTHGKIGAALRLDDAPQAGPRFLAGLDGLTGSVLRGWALDLWEAQARVSLVLTVRGRALVRLQTGEHRADLVSVMAGNVAGFTLDLAALESGAAEALAAALFEAEPAEPPPAELVALRVEEDNSAIDFAAFGLNAGALLAAFGRAAPPPPPEPVRAEARALHWLRAHLSAQVSTAGPLARTFSEKLAADIERSDLISASVKRHVREIAPLFDPFHYLEQLDEAGDALANPLLHYALAGWRAGLSPSPLFAPDFYLHRRGAIAGDPLLDFLREGAARGIDPHPLFEIAFYRSKIETAGVNPLAHYLGEGGRRRIDPGPLFDSQAILAAYGLAEETANPLEAFLTNPACFDFAVLPAFDAPFYRHQIEVERGGRLREPPLAHYLARGWRDETLLPNLLFDPAFYRERHKLEFSEPALIHYLREGEAAGLACHPHFAPAFYNAERGVEGPQGALAHALAHPGEARSDPRMDAAIDVRLFDFARELVAEGGRDEFRAALYLKLNPDLGAPAPAVAEAHFRDAGRSEGRIASLTGLARFVKLTLRELPLGFVLADYTMIYPDLAGFEKNFFGGLLHYFRFGRQEKRLIGRWLFRIDGLTLQPPSAAAPLKVERKGGRADVCILIHAFYADLLPELAGFAQNFRDVSFDIFINVVDLAWTPAVHEELRAICPGAFVLLSNDDGRDIGGFTRLLTHVDIAAYDVFAFLHSKKSPHVAPEKGEYWRRSLLKAFAGSPEIARECIEAFKADPHLGLIGAKEWRSQDMGKNVEHYEKLLDLLGVRGRARELDYISGFMFLTRADVVARLFEVMRRLDFEYGGDKDLDFHTDGQIAHGVERAVPALVRQMGYEILYR